MTIIPVRHTKRLYLPLLLLADEQEDMIDRYLERGDMYVLDDEGVKAEVLSPMKAAAYSNSKYRRLPRIAKARIRKSAH